MYPIFIFGLFISDGLQEILSGILKGIELKEIVTYSSLFVYYVIGVPLILLFSYEWGAFGLGWKIYGVWFAFTIE